MYRMLNLIRNENMKTFRRLSTWIMLGLLVLMVAASLIIVEFVIPKADERGDWKTELAQQNEMYRKSMQQPGIQKVGLDQMEKLIRINEYRIEHDLPPMKNESLWGFVISSKGLVSLVSLFVIIIGAGSVANEFSAGTIKLLLLRPVKRWKILLSKYISTMVSALLMLVTLFASSFVIGAVFFGFGGVSQPYLAYVNEQVVERNIMLHALSQYGYACVDMIMMVTFAFMISAVTRNNALAIGLSVFLMFTGNTVVAIFSKYSWVKYILFANTDLTVYIDGVPLVEGMTMGFSILVLTAYFVLFNLISWTTFIKRDVAV